MWSSSFIASPLSWPELGPRAWEGGMERMWWVLFHRTQKAGMGPPLHVPEGKDIPFVQAQLR